MAPSNDPRVERMYRGDRMWAVVALFTLWATYTFVFWKILPLLTDSGVLYSLAVGAGLVLLFNSAAIYAMIAHYIEDKQNIYGLDLHYLDLSKSSKN